MHETNEIKNPVGASIVGRMATGRRSVPTPVGADRCAGGVRAQVTWPKIAQAALDHVLLVDARREVWTGTGDHLRHAGVTMIGTTPVIAHLHEDMPDHRLGATLLDILLHDTAARLLVALLLEVVPVLITKLWMVSGALYVPLRLLSTDETFDPMCSKFAKNRLCVS